ncbi:hypothetical protein BY996DRAFT_6413081 [Phakopsora pachyrhizi]|nr:hypothetical protein BY996DRAFT_6413081 [Phakopsora pachyrhizi]
MGLTTPNQVDKLNPRKNEFEFGGILGALGITITVPISTYLLNLSCQPIVGGKLNSFETISKIQEVWNEQDSLFMRVSIFASVGTSTWLSVWEILPGRFVQDLDNGHSYM